MTDPLTQRQWKVLLAIADAIVADLTDEETRNMLVDSRSSAVTENIDACKEFAKARFSSNSTFTTALREELNKLAPDKRLEMGGVLDMLDSHLGSLVLTRHFTVFTDLSREDREKAITSWFTSRLSKIRGLPRGVAALVLATFTRHSDLRFLDYDDGDYSRAQDVKFNAPKYEFLNVGTHEEEIYTDVLVIGSGSGGGVAASTLAKAGRRVLIVEKSGTHEQNSFPMKEHDAFSQMYENQGIMTTEDNGMTVLAGSTLGGGSTINWSASLQTPGSVRQEWTDKTGIQWFIRPEFQTSLDYVCERMGVSAQHVRQNFANSKLLEGSKKLGHHSYVVPQNTGGQEHYCGHCPHGCREGAKQGGLITWLADAKDAGAQFLKHTLVKKVIIEKGVAVGALVSYQGRDLTIRANKVILSAGTLNTPCLLKASGVRNGNVGKNLKLHPVSFVTAHYENERTRPHEGGILTAISLAAANRDGKGHGAYLEVVSNQAGLHSVMIPWRGAADWKRTMLKYPQATTYIALSRDRDSGYVFPDPATGKPKVQYVPSKFDAESILEGVVKLCDISLAAGADEITTAQLAVPPFRPNKASTLGIHDPAYKEWIAKVRAEGIVSGRTAMGSAHQMGTCAMGTVCDENAQVLGVKNLWIADASVFPTCSGVNPMVTTMAIAHHTALKIIEADELAQANLHKEFSAKL